MLRLTTFIILSLCLLVQSPCFSQIDHLKAYAELKAMLEGKQPKDFKRAVFLTENAYHKKKLSEEAFNQQIQQIVKTLNKMITEKGFQQYKTAGNWAIHHYLCKPIPENNFTPYVYDFNDPYGYNNWTNKFVTKLLRTKKGNCQSLPYLYKILAEEMGAEAYLAHAPSHLYIKHKDEKGRWFNLELTNGTFSSDAWIISSTHIKAEAIENGVYMKAMSMDESIALCLIDLAQGYRQRYSYDALHLEMLDTALKYYPNCVLGIGEKSNNFVMKMNKLSSLKRYTHIEQIRQDPTINPLLEEVERLTEQINALGYEEMPEEQYGDWVKVMQKEEEARRAKEKAEALQKHNGNND
ncbi:MAG: hypothetical protein AAF734_01345 [Bacteroidota bacterium]